MQRNITMYMQMSTYLNRYNAYTNMLVHVLQIVKRNYVWTNGKVYVVQNVKRNYVQTNVER